jgi:carboxymethylenebutenolidase
MGEHIKITAADGCSLDGYRAEPNGALRGGLMVCQETFGVNRHIRSVCDRFAEVGYLAIAPAQFDQAQKEVEIGYTPDDIARGREIMQKLNLDNAVKDVAAAVGLVDEKPRCPVMLHFVDQDQSIPMEVAEKVRKAHVSLPLHVYHAGHGFNCEERGPYDAESAKALQHTLDFFRQHIG